MSPERRRHYLSWDPWAGSKDDGGARATSVKIVKTRKAQQCMASEKTHEIPVGAMARREKAIFEGKWCSWYACLDCIDRESEEYEH